MASSSEAADGHDLFQQIDPVRDDAVNAPPYEALHVFGPVDGPRQDRDAAAVRVPDEAVTTTLCDELAAEGPGVLAWIVEGCRSWLANGLRPAAEVVAGEF